MLKRVLKPDDTHLMASNEEYCRIIYERQWNAPDVFDLSIEVFDKGGVRVKQNYQKITAQNEKEIIKDVLGDGWETIFMQDYEDWMIRCQKRPRSASAHSKYLPKRSTANRNSFWRQLVIGGMGIVAIALVMGWVSGQFPQSLPTGDDPALNPDGANPDGGNSDRANPEGGNSETTADEDGGVSEEKDDSLQDAVTDQNATPDDVDSSAEDGDIPSPLPLSTAPTEDDPFVLAVRLAQQAVVAGRDAETQAEWEALAVRWQEAADLMAEVSSDDERYDIAQDRVATYEANRDVALSEAEKTSSN